MDIYEQLYIINKVNYNLLKLGKVGGGLIEFDPNEMSSKKYRRGKGVNPHIFHLKNLAK